jgi:Ni,Fe-hydrogenase I small subunit
MIDIVIHNIEKIAGIFLLAAFAGYFVRRNRRKERATMAAAVFRVKVLAELEGLYPVRKHWKSEIFHRFGETIPAIESAAEKFRHFLPSGSRKSFDDALKNYCEHCKEITWGDCATFGIVPGERKPEDEGPKEIFRQNVNALLSFAKDV